MGKNFFSGCEETVLDWRERHKKMAAPAEFKSYPCEFVGACEQGTYSWESPRDKMQFVQLKVAGKKVRVDNHAYRRQIMESEDPASIPLDATAWISLTPEGPIYEVVRSSVKRLEKNESPLFLVVSTNQ